MVTCSATCNSGKRCKNKVIKGNLCKIHREKSKNTCSGQTILGNPCTKSVREEGDYCHLHVQKLEVKYTCGSQRTKGRGKCKKPVYSENEKCSWHNEKIEEIHKICGKCYESKLLGDFYPDMTGTNGRMRVCKNCLNTFRRNVEHPRVTSGAKFCFICEEDKDVSLFWASKGRKDGLFVYCIICSNTERSKYVSTFTGYIGKIFSSIKSDAKKREPPLEVNITKQNIIDLYNKQDGLCNKSEKKMTYVSLYDPDQIERVNRAHYYNMSVDRIDSNKGYILDNIQLVCYAFNMIKWDMIEEDCIEQCLKIKEYEKSISNKSVKLTHISEKFIKEAFERLTIRASEKEIEVEIVIEDIFELYENTGAICQLSGTKLTTINTSKRRGFRSMKNKGGHLHKANYANLSVDRIDSSGDYTIDNIQLVCSVINDMKGDMPQDIFIEFCTVVAIQN